MTASTNPWRITPKQGQALELLATCKSQKVVAAMMDIGEHGVRQHIEEARARMGMSTTACVIAWRDHCMKARSESNDQVKQDNLQALRALQQLVHTCRRCELENQMLRPTESEYQAALEQAERVLREFATHAAAAAAN